MKLSVVLIVLLACLFACGRRGDQQPPDQNITESFLSRMNGSFSQIRGGRTLHFNRGDRNVISKNVRYSAVDGSDALRYRCETIELLQVTEVTQFGVPGILGNFSLSYRIDRIDLTPGQDPHCAVSIDKWNADSGRTYTEYFLGWSEKYLFSIYGNTGIDGALFLRDGESEWDFTEFLPRLIGGSFSEETAYNPIRFVFSNGILSLSRDDSLNCGFQASAPVKRAVYQRQKRGGNAYLLLRRGTYLKTSSIKNSCDLTTSVDQVFTKEYAIAFRLDQSFNRETGLRNQIHLESFEEIVRLRQNP